VCVGWVEWVFAWGWVFVVGWCDCGLGLGFCVFGGGFVVLVLCCGWFVCGFFLVCDCCWCVGLVLVLGLVLCCDVWWLLGWFVFWLLGFFGVLVAVFVVRCVGCCCVGMGEFGCCWGRVCGVVRGGVLWCVCWVVCL